MAGDALRAIGGALFGAVTGRQSYFLEVPSAATAVALSVVSFEAVERLGEPYKVSIRLTHPLELDRAEYLNRDATFVIDAGDGAEPRKFAGWISKFSKTRQTADFCAYEIVVEPLAARLPATPRSRIYQNKTAPQIIEAILRGHDLAGHQFAFKTRREYPEHAFHLQHEIPACRSNRSHSSSSHARTRTDSSDSVRATRSPVHIIERARLFLNQNSITHPASPAPG